MIRSHVLLAVFVPASVIALAGCGGAPDADSSTVAAADTAPLTGERYPVVGGDADGDGYASPTDCDDTNAAINPAATEADNLVDDDCDGWVDETFVAAGDVVVSEINRQARFGTAGIVNDGSWVEVYNTSSRTIDLANWTLARGTSTSGNQITLDATTAPVIAPGDYAVFCDTDNYQGSSVAWPLTCDYVWGDETQASTYVGTYHDNTFYLHRDADTFALYIGGSRTTGTLVDSVSWTYDATNGYWPRDASFSLSLDPAYLTSSLNDNRLAWCSTSSSATGVATKSNSWRWYDNSTTTNDEYGTPGYDNYDCLNDPDLDADGYTGATDCNDADATINPGATEVCDGIDNDCDGVVDITPAFADADGDGYGDAGVPNTSCSLPSGYVTNSTDCDDTDASANPGATESDDLVDNDCDGYVDETFVAAGDLVVSEINKQARFGGTTAVPNGSWVEVYNTSSRTIDMSNWTIARGTSTSGYAIAIDPAAAPVIAPHDYAVFCDTDDYISSGTAAFPLTCDYVWGDETQPSTYQGTYHNNKFALNSTADTFALYSAGSRTTGTLIDSVTWTYDATNGYWPLNARFSVSLDPAYLTGTLNDNRLAWCSTTASATGAVSNNTTWRWYDTSGTVNDEHGTPGAANYDCLNDPDIDGDGYTGATDCNDGNANVHPGATELCNSVDDDCNGTVDDSAIPLTYYADADADGYGNAAVTTAACGAPSGYTADATDCDDTLSSVNPGADEVCDNGIDDDCEPDPTVCEWSGSRTVSSAYDFRAYGTAASYLVGTSIADNGDFNGDGYADVVVGQSYWDTSPATDNGRAYVWYGPVTSAETLSTADLTVDGDSTRNFDYFGSSSRFAGDVDGDGKDDLLVSSWKSHTNDRGTTYLFLGGTSPTVVGSAFASFSTPDATNYMGQGIDGGDIDGDGLADVAVSAYGRTSLAGAVGIWNSTAIGGGAEVLATTATALITGVTAADNLGYSLAVAPDLDGDGLADLVLGAPASASTTTPGRAYVFYGADALSGTLAASTADVTLTGSANGDRFGLAVAGLGDMDGDGSNDFAITADKNDTASTDSGAVYIVTTAPTSSGTGAAAAASILTGEVTSDFFGRTVAGIGDINGDGFADLAAGATGYDAGTINGAGAVYIVYGPPPAGGTTSASLYDARYVGANGSDAVGYAVSGGGDVDGDGYADFMTSATSWDSFGLLNAGAAWLFYGRGE
jgi:hypothetical protein